MINQAKVNAEGNNKYEIKNLFTFFVSLKRHIKPDYPISKAKKTLNLL